jgi:hypothetical protein
MVDSSISAKERDWTRYFLERIFRFLRSREREKVAQPDEGRLGKTILLQQLHGEIALGQMLDFRQKLIGQNRNVRLLQSGGVKDVYDLVRRNGAGNDLPDGQLPAM